MSGATPVPAGRAPSAPAGRAGPVARVVEVVAWLALALFVVGGVGGSLTGERVFLGTDTLESFEPWRAEDRALEVPTNGWVGDTIDAVVPRTVFVAENLREGDLPQWNPWAAGGTPAAPLPDNAPFSPLSLPWYVLPSTVAPAAVKVLEIVTIAVGMVLLGRRLGLPRSAAAVASLVYASSGFMIAWTNWTQTRVAAFVPLLFWAVDRAVVRRRPRDAVPLALVVAAMLAGGFPAVTGWALYFAGAYAVVRTLAQRPAPRAVVRSAAVAGAGVLAGILLLAWQLVPFVQRTLGVVDLEARRQRPDIHLEWTTLASAVVPGILGGPRAQWATVWNPIESFSYIGAAAVVLGLVGLVAWRGGPGARGVKGFVLGALAVSVVLVYVGGPALALAQELPVFADNVVARMRVMVGFFAALAAGLGFAAVLGRVPAGARPTAPTATAATAAGSGGAGTGPAATAARTPARTPSPTAAPTPWLTPRPLRVAAAVVVAIGALLVVGRVLTFVPPEQRRALVVAAALAGALAAVTLALALVARRRGWGATAFGVLVPVLVAVPAVDVARTWWPQGEPEMFYPMTPTHRFLADHLGDDRYITVDQTMLPGTSTFYGLRAADGHAFHTPQWRDLLMAAEPDVAWGGAGTYTSLRSGSLATSLASPVLDRIGVRYVTAPTGAVLPGEHEVVVPSTGTLVVAPDATAAEPSGPDAVAPPVRVTGPFRGVLLDLPQGLPVDLRGAEVTVSVTRPDGTPVLATGRTIGPPAAGPFWLAVAAEDLGADEPVDVTLGVTGAVGPAVLGAADGVPALTVVRPPGDDLTVVSTGGATVVERETALSRVRWAGREVVEADPAARTALLASGRVPADAVVLQDPADARGGAGAAGTVDVVRDDGDLVEVAVRADGDGWLVVADALQGAGGWRAELDGEPVDLVDAEHAGGAVRVPAGEHTVRLSYSMPGVLPGAGVAGVTALGLLAAVLLDRRRTRRTVGAGAPAPAGDRAGATSR